jgi:hypothetical protein
MPAQQDHAIRIAGDVAMRTVFVREDARAHLPRFCEVIEVSPFCGKRSWPPRAFRSTMPVVGVTKG